MGKSCRITGVVHLPPFGVDRIHVEGLECWLLEQIGRHVEYGITSMMIQDQTPGERAGLKNVAILYLLLIQFFFFFFFPARKLVLKILIPLP